MHQVCNIELWDFRSVYFPCRDIIRPSIEPVVAEDEDEVNVHEDCWRKVIRGQLIMSSEANVKYEQFGVRWQKRGGMKTMKVCAF